jgi:AcrR family transcriptional regulator
MAVLGGARRNGRTETVGERTRLEILEATETLLAVNGPNATSIRSIAARADVNVAAVNYHFHSKDGLIDELLRRRATPLNQERLRRLDACLAGAASSAVKLEDVLHAFVTPMFEFAANEHLAARALVSAQFLSRAAHRPGGFTSADDLHEMLERRFLQAFAAALPGLDPATLRGRYRFLEGAITLAMCGEGIVFDDAERDDMQRKAARIAAMRAAAANFITFASAGMRG